MESSSFYNNNRKSSSATIVPPAHSKFNARKASLIPLKINTAGTKNIFYDTGSMTEISPTTVVSYNEEQEQSTQNADHSWLQKIKQRLNPTKTAKNADKTVHFKDKHMQEKQRFHNNQSSRVVQHSYSDPRLSPGSTAVGDDEDDEEQQGYFSAVPIRKVKRSPRGWVAAVLMIVFGALIAITFVLVGLGKALSGNGDVASVQNNSTSSTTTAMPTTSSVSMDKNSSTSASSLSHLASETVKVAATESTAIAHKVANPTATSS